MKEVSCEFKCEGYPNTDCPCSHALKEALNVREDFDDFLAGIRPKKLSPLAEADKIVNKRAEERDRDYGGFSASMMKTAVIASELCNKQITTEDCFKVLMALKLSRLSNSNKLDSFTDLIGYTEGWWNFIQEKDAAK